MKLDIDPDVKVLLPDGSTNSLLTYQLPSAILVIAALLLMVSMFQPYWRITMTAPQYPKGLTVDVYVNHLEGDMAEIDGLNHYLGMPPLDEGGRFERTISIVALAILALLLVAATFIHNKWAAIFSLPALFWPIIFLADLWLILYTYGHSIDPESALGGAIEPFTPPILGTGKIAQFGTTAELQVGFYLALAAVVVILIGLWFHRAAYKPILDARSRVKAQERPAES
jgi:hypothetical protein